MNLFEDILRRYPETDKLNGFYEHAYEDSFLAYREKVKLLFEIGVYHGGSVLSFREYFPNALIVGIDINPARLFTADRVKIEIGDASSKDFIDSLVNKYGSPDVVVDDGSHKSHEIKAAFNYLYPLTNICYVMEDLNTQYAGYEGGRFITDGQGAVQPIHVLLDELMQKPTTANIRCYHAICFIFKSAVELQHA